MSVTDFEDGPRALMWFVGALALIAAGARMILRMDGVSTPVTALWGRWKAFFALLIVGVCAWMWVMATDTR